MFSAISSITIKGAAFPDTLFYKGTKLDIFKNKLNLIYGKNGSGKSSIASAIKDYAEGNPLPEASVSFNVEIPAENRSEIHVFNEKFIQDNLLVKKNGLSNIVMVGSTNVDLSNQIQVIDEQISLKRTELSGIADIIRDLGDKKKPDSVEAKKAALVGSLREKGFEERTVQIKNIGAGKQQTGIRINDTLLDSIGCALNSGVSGSVDEMKARFEQCITILQSGGGAESKVYWTKPDVKTPDSLKGVNELLGRQILRPELSDRERQIFARFDDAKRSLYLRQAHEDIVNAKATICPLCHQAINEKHRDLLSETITRLLGDDASEYEEALKQVSAGLGEITVQPPTLPKNLYSDHVRNLEAACALLNKELTEARNAVDARVKDIYTASSYRFSEDDFNQRIQGVKAALDVLDQDVKEYNKSIDDRSSIRNEAENLNLQIAYIESLNLMKEYQAARQKLDDATTKQVKVQKEIDGLVKNRNALGMKMQQTETACEYINAQLRNVFYSSDRLALKGSDNGEYVLYSRGRAVAPDKVSTGERNIIALAYFFATLFSGKTERNKYSDKAMLVVIDDPVSSFDYGNRTGITAYLMNEIQRILSGNSNSKVLVLSHDIQTIYHLSRLIRKKDQEYRFYELASGRLTGFEEKDNEYWKLLQDVFEYANGRNLDDEGIGNKMRRVLETYSTFMFQCGFKDMFDKEYLYDNVPEEKRDFYKNFIGRIILDSTSHSGNQVNTLDFTTSLFSRDEKLHTAKGILKFLYYVSPTHLKAYLVFAHQYDTVRSWVEED